MRSVKIVAGVTLAVLVTSFGGAPSRADTVLQTSNSGGVGNQDWSGVGVEFTVNAPITVTSLGIFDSTPPGITGPLTADLMTLTGSPLASQVFLNASGPLTAGGYQFQSITPVTLGVGTYYLMGYGWTPGDSEHNSNVDGSVPDTFNTGGGLVSFVQAVWTESNVAPPGTLPNQAFGPTFPNFFSSANMAFTAAIPEASTWIMMLLGFCGLGFLAYRRKSGALRLV